MESDRSEFDFIEPDKKKNYRKEKVLITDADITTVTQQITHTWEKIQQHDFIPVAAAQIVIGAILLRQINWQLPCDPETEDE